MNNELKPKAIAKLLPYNFLIPSYQRGYRWGHKQVTALLKDIWEYVVDHNNPKAFYCLQPIVVKEVAKENKNEDMVYELIDGQQRLTTILLILHYFNKTEFKTPKPIYGLTFSTREQQENFLEVIGNDKICHENIDLFHLNKAYYDIAKWFEIMGKSMPSVKGDFYSKLTNKVKVIWYFIKDDTDVVDIFTRLNIGKIPLTNAELVKALFLIKTNFDGDASLQQIQIATEWDVIEKRLQDDSFWFFIYSPTHSVHYDNRIEYIFDLMQKKSKEHEEFHTFNKFSEEFEEDKLKNKQLNINKHWLKIKQYFQRLEEWFADNELYHLIGFLIEYGTSINQLKEKASEVTKSEFVDYLKELIKEKLNRVEIETLAYGNKDIRKVLLLFNIQTILSTHKAEMRFPFNKFKQENWNIEHVNSLTDNSDSIRNPKIWALDSLEYFTGISGFDTVAVSDNDSLAAKQKHKAATIESDIEKEICNILVEILESEDEEHELLEEAFLKLRTLFEEDSITDINSISNLTLLDEHTNKSYGNAMFPVKRNRIIRNDKLGLFVPICTKNLFLKYYSDRVKSGMNWTQSDADNYLSNMTDVLKEFLPINNEDHGK